MYAYLYMYILGVHKKTTTDACNTCLTQQREKVCFLRVLLPRFVN